MHIYIAACDYKHGNGELCHDVPSHSTPVFSDQKEPARKSVINMENIEPAALLTVISVFSP